jgi:hypothetical protein
MRKEFDSNTGWIVIGRPGYQGKSQDEQQAAWDKEYGKGGWRMAWQLATGEILDFDGIFYHYVESYARYFLTHPGDAKFLAASYSYAYDKDLVTKIQAFDPHFLYQKPGRPNQFHHVALNLALERRLDQPFKGPLPVQVREGKPGTDPSTWPAGWKWSPGRIPAFHPEQIPDLDQPGWWQTGSIEHLYQSAKILQIKK